MINLKGRIGEFVNRLSFVSVYIPIGSLRFRIYECPGVWLSDRKLKALTEDLIKVATKCQGSTDIPLYGVLKGERADMSKRLITVAYDCKTGDPVGFSAQIFLDLEHLSFRERVLHLGLIYVDSSVQGKNISYLLSVLPNLLIMVKNAFRDTWISNVSQVPAVCGLVATNYSQVYPNINKTSQTFMHRKIAELIMRDHRAAFGVGEEAGFDFGRQVIKNAYTGGSDNLKKSFHQCPKFRDERMNQLCQSELDYERGDDFLQVGVLSTASIINLYKKKLNASNIISITIALICVGVLAIFIPVLRWLIKNDDSKKNNFNQFKKVVW